MSEDRSFSKTNNQVNGVDEADIIKTNGDFIYYLKNNELLVFENRENLKLLKTITFNKKVDSNLVKTIDYEESMVTPAVIILKFLVE